MKHQPCPLEEKITAASRSGLWSDTLLAHVAACASCEETTLVASYLSESNAAALSDRLPDPGRIWFKAQIAAKTEAMERAMRPILWARRFALGVGAAFVVTFIVMSWSRLGAFGADSVNIWTHRTPAAAARGGNLLFLLAATFLLILPPLLFGLYSVWSED